MGCVTSIAKKIFLAILSLLKVGVAVAIIVIVTKKLLDVRVVWDGLNKKDMTVCFLGKDFTSYSLCAYAYAVASISIIVCGLIAMLLCCTCNLCGIGGLVEVLLAVVGTGWWTAAGIVFNKNAMEANDANVPEERARMTVMVLCWVEVALFALTVLVALVTAINCLRKCLCCCCGDDDDKKSNKVMAA